eukprot:gene7873-1407_t
MPLKTPAPWVQHPIAMHGPHSADGKAPTTPSAASFGMNDSLAISICPLTFARRRDVNPSVLHQVDAHGMSPASPSASSLPALPGQSGALGPVLPYEQAHKQAVPLPWLEDQHVGQAHTTGQADPQGPPRLASPSQLFPEPPTPSAGQLEPLPLHSDSKAATPPLPTKPLPNDPTAAHKAGMPLSDPVFPTPVPSGTSSKVARVMFQHLLHVYAPAGDDIPTHLVVRGLRAWFGEDLIESAGLQQVLDIVDLSRTETVSHSTLRSCLGSLQALLCGSLPAFELVLAKAVLSRALDLLGT